MSAEPEAQLPAGGRFAPLREPVFRRIWSASLFSNFGQLILGVGAAWEMTRLSGSPAMVALVQSAMMLPLMLVAMPAGAAADMFDRRRIAIGGLSFAILSSLALTGLAFAGLTSPGVLLGFCVLIGSGVAFYGPAWQASIGEQVGQEHLPAAVALGTISYNVARSFGPAVGGVIVLLAGAQAAFAVNALCYVPLLLAFGLWRRPMLPSRLPPERIDRAIYAGARYARHSSPIRRVVLRAFAFALASASTSALAPLIAKDMLGGDAGTYGLLLGATGVGAVLGALIVADVRDRLSTETALRVFALVGGGAIAVIAISRNVAVTGLSLALLGAVNILNIALLNVGVQLSVPRWVTARALSIYQSALTGGIAIGAAAWGAVAARAGLQATLFASALLVAATAALGFVARLAEPDEDGLDTVDLGEDPQLALPVTMRSGPVTIEIDYCVDPSCAREFYDAMRAVRRTRLRNGGFDWSIARNLADPAIWTERYSCSTWGDYLRIRARFTQADLAAQAAADAFMLPGCRHVVRRCLERPFGSVRWRQDSPDTHQDTGGIIAP
ncbi:MFS transporter [Sphingomonas tabacisoli]|uniref:MFS transporter n=1 Tax=Sphingomonas tabacisoli TaxID=2249466 RepID=A0ABW4I8W9_9SPHN